MYALGGVFRFVQGRNAIRNALFKVYPQVMRAATQRPIGNSQLACHAPVMFDFFMAMVQVVLKNQFSFFARKKFQAFQKTLILVALISDLTRKHRHYISRDLFPSPSLENDISGDTVKVTSRLANVVVANVGQTVNHPVDRLIG
jgi:hypothetical protein